VDFTFDGRTLRGFRSEPVSTALAAAGVATFSRHFKDEAPQGIFCANGQCSQCTLVIDGLPRKSCVTPLEEGMEVLSLEGHPKLPADDLPFAGGAKEVLSCDILVIGGGPSGIAAAVELGKLGFSVILADDKERLGGKLVLQTHKFFGSEEDCYAGVRGIDIAAKLETELRSTPNVRVLTNSPVVGVFKDRKAGVYLDYKRYVLVDFRALLVASGARERSILFPGNDLPGVFGAGAFQTLVNRDFVRPSKRVLIVGSGNVGLIAAYHALQAGIEVVGIVDILGKPNGYKVHADKIVRMGVPIHLSTTVLSVTGEGRVERATVAKVDGSFNPIFESARTYEVDTVLVATGLSSCDEFYRQAEAFGIPAVTAGDAEEIAEASSAMFGGRISAQELARKLGRNVAVNEEWVAKREVLRSRPGDWVARPPEQPEEKWKPIITCNEEIPCNPCTTVCPTNSITLKEKKGSILDVPWYSKRECIGCGACVAICPGLAISLVRRVDDDWAETVLPYEFDAPFEKGARLLLLDKEGLPLEEAELRKKVFNRKHKTWLLTFKTSSRNATRASGIRVQDPAIVESRSEPVSACPPDDAIVCRCERVTVGEIVDFIRDNEVRDINQLKSIRVGMGSCGSKTCSAILPSVFRKAGLDPAMIEKGSQRPLNMEVRMGDLANEGGSGGQGQFGAGHERGEP
jgi:NADPH-dependent 2,4-dienoyl-CoA reductase/sulfur reductase-like enzyme/Fe-S-cluster-containing hydrogenase component 2